MFRASTVSSSDPSRLRASLRFASIAAVLLVVAPACDPAPEPPEGSPWNGVQDDDDAGTTGEPSEDPSESQSESSAQGTDEGGAETDPSDGNTSRGGSTRGSDDDSGSGTEGPGGSLPPSSEVPNNKYCTPVSSWEAEWLALEDEILEIVNQKRSEGANCNTEGSFGSAPPLTMAPGLRCAARVHSKDMADRDFFDHSNPSGESPWDRMGKAGYSYAAAGENIAAGNPTASATMDQWMTSDGHCANIMNPDFTELGVGYYPGGQYGHLWTQVFGRPQ